MAHVHAVRFVDRTSEDGALEVFDALVPGHIEAGATVDRLYAIEGGRLELKTSVPHGSADQGYTWF